jgi:hypothetical protein
LEGRVDCEYDWGAVSSIASAFLPEGLKLEGKRKDTINFSSEYPTDKGEELLANLSTKGKVGFERAEYMGLNFGPTEVDIQIDKGLMRIAPFSTIINEGKFSYAAAQADFKQEPTLLKTDEPIQMIKDIKINDETTKQLLIYVNPVFANALNVRGIANFHCEKLSIPLAGATRNDLVVIGTLSISDLRWASSADLLGKIMSIIGERADAQVITIHPTRFVLQNGVLGYEDMQMDVGDNPVNFKGKIGLDKKLDMKVTLPYTTEGRTVRTDDVSNTNRIVVTMRGTIDKPELDLGKVLEQVLLQKLLGKKSKDTPDDESKEEPPAESEEDLEERLKKELEKKAREVLEELLK